jgi:hypothetical protein
MASEGFYGPLSEPYGAAAVLRLRLSENIPGALARERPAYPDRGAVEVNVIPIEAQKLVAPHARVNGEHVESFKLISVRHFKQFARLRNGERMHLFRCGRGSFDRIRRVAGDKVPLHSLGEHLV